MRLTGARARSYNCGAGFCPMRMLLPISDGRAEAGDGRPVRAARAAIEAGPPTGDEAKA